MSKIASIQDLQKVAKDYTKDFQLLLDAENPDGFTVIKVAMATCSMAAGAEQIFNVLTEYVEKRGINAIVTKTGCMGYCYAEPTIEVKLPGKSPVVFRDVDEAKADAIVERYIKNGEQVEGTIPLDYLNVNEI